MTPVLAVSSQQRFAVAVVIVLIVGWLVYIVSVDTKQPIQGPPIGTNTTGQEAEGPHCIGGRSE